MRSVVRVLVVVVSAGIAVLAWRWFRSSATKPATGKPAAVVTKTQEPAAIDPAVLPGMYQGPIARADGTEEWLVLEITRVVLAANDEATFDFTLSSIKDSVRDQGRASLREKWIRFSGLSGEIRRQGNGSLVLRSVPINGPPNWMLERSRT